MPPTNEQSTTCLVKSDTTVVLQTVRACVINIREDQVCVVNVLFDTGSQQTFVSDRTLACKRTQVSTIWSNSHGS